MISAALRQLFYVAETQSFASIARSTGIPYRTVLAMRSGKIDLSSTFKNSLRNMYQRTAYGRLRNIGFSASESRRWSWYRPERVVVHEASLKYKIGELTTGAVAAKLRAKGLPTTEGTVSDLFDQMYEKVKEGIQRSIEPTEIIYDY
jgi:hypothetical protein